MPLPRAARLKDHLPANHPWNTTAGHTPPANPDTQQPAPQEPVQEPAGPAQTGTPAPQETAGARAADGTLAETRAGGPAPQEDAATDDGDTARATYETDGETVAETLVAGPAPQEDADATDDTQEDGATDYDGTAHDAYGTYGAGGGADYDVMDDAETAYETDETRAGGFAPQEDADATDGDGTAHNTYDVADEDDEDETVVETRTGALAPQEADAGDDAYEAAETHMADFAPQEDDADYGATDDGDTAYDTYEADTAQNRQTATPAARRRHDRNDEADDTEIVAETRTGTLAPQEPPQDTAQPVAQTRHAATGQPHAVQTDTNTTGDPGHTARTRHTTSPHLAPQPDETGQNPNHILNTAPATCTHGHASSHTASVRAIPGEYLKLIATMADNPDLKQTDATAIALALATGRHDWLTDRQDTAVHHIIDKCRTVQDRYQGVLVQSVQRHNGRISQLVAMSVANARMLQMLLHPDMEDGDAGDPAYLMPEYIDGYDQAWHAFTGGVDNWNREFANHMHS